MNLSCFHQFSLEQPITRFHCCDLSSKAEICSLPIFQLPFLQPGLDRNQFIFCYHLSAVKSCLHTVSVTCLE